MSTVVEAVPSSDRELVLTRIINAPREKVYKAWTEPKLLKQWFAPPPFTTPVAELDVRLTSGLSFRPLGYTRGRLREKFL